MKPLVKRGGLGKSGSGNPFVYPGGFGTMASASGGGSEDWYEVNDADVHIERAYNWTQNGTDLTIY